MAELKENLAYLSEITGMECKEGNFDQITRVASNLYVDGHNYMMGKDWTQLDEQKLDQLCAEMKKALSKNSKKNVARIKWNDPWAPVFPIYPKGATEERKNETEEFWKNYEETRFKNGIRMSERAEQKAKEKTVDSAMQFFAEDQDFWEYGSEHAYTHFDGEDTKERGGFVRLLLYAQGLTEEEVLDDKSRIEEKKQTVDQVKRVVDKKSGLSTEKREEEMEKLLKEAENALYKRTLRPLDLNDINSFEDYTYNQMVVGEYNDLFQIVEENRYRSKACKDLYVRFREGDSLSIVQSILRFDSKRASRELSDFNDDHWNFENIPLENIPKADMEDLNGMIQQAKIDVMGLKWNDIYKEMFLYARDQKVKAEKENRVLEKLKKSDQVKLTQLGEQYNETTSEIEKQMIHNEQVQISSQYSLEPEEQEKLKEVNETPKKDAEKNQQEKDAEKTQQKDTAMRLFEKLKNVDQAYLKSSEEFKKLKTSLAEAVNADPDDISQKMQEVYENANEYILRKAAKPATGHGKERLAVAREIRNTISEMLKQKDSYYQMAEMFDFIRAPWQAEKGTEAECHQKNITKYIRRKVLKKINSDNFNTPLDDNERLAVATAFTVAEEYYDSKKKNSVAEKTKIKETALEQAKNTAIFVEGHMSESPKDLYDKYLKQLNYHSILYREENHKKAIDNTVFALQIKKIAIKITKENDVLDSKKKRRQMVNNDWERIEKRVKEEVCNESPQKEYESEHKSKKKSAGRSL